MASLLIIFLKNVKNVFCLTNIFQFYKYRLFVFINVRNMSKEEQSSDKLRLHWRLLYDKRPAENDTLLFSVFWLFQHQHDFCQKFNEQGRLLKFFQLLLFYHFVHSAFYTNKKNQVYRNANVFVNLLYHSSVLLCSRTHTRTLSLSTKEPGGPSTKENKRLVFFNCFCFRIFLFPMENDETWSRI